MSDERTNREVLKWAKAWDKFVFQKQSKGPQLNASIFSSVSEGGVDDPRPEHKVDQNNYNQAHDVSTRDASHRYCY